MNQGWDPPPGGQPPYPPQPATDPNVAGLAAHQPQGMPQAAVAAYSQAGAYPPGPGRLPGRAAEVSDVMQAFKALLSRGTRGLLGAYLILAVARLITTAPGWVLSYLQLSSLERGDLSGMTTYSVAGICTSVLQIGLGLVIGAVSIGMYRPARMLLVGEGAAVGGAGSVLKLSTQRFLPSLGVVLLVGVAIFLGALFCLLPGLVVAFFLMLAPYLVAAVDQDVVDSLKRSFELAKTNIVTLLLAIGGLIGLTVIMVVVQMVLAVIAGSTGSMAATILIAPVVTVIGIAIGYPVFLFFAAVCIAVETTDAGVTLDA